jgi:cytochrome c-type biogenesis protein CcmH/NrfG
VSHGVTPPPDPDPRLSVESLEQQLRALPPAQVPEALPSKLIASIPAAKAAGSLVTSIASRWPWIVGVAVLCITVPATIYLWQMDWGTKPPAGADANRESADSSNAGKNEPATSKDIQTYEQAVRFDPYNADAWFSLAKAQAQVNRSEDAISSARKAIDIGRSRNRSDFVGAVETWLRAYQAPKAGQPRR